MPDRLHVSSAQDTHRQGCLSVGSLIRHRAWEHLLKEPIRSLLIPVEALGPWFPAAILLQRLSYRPHVHPAVPPGNLDENFFRGATFLIKKVQPLKRSVWVRALSVQLRGGQDPRRAPHQRARHAVSAVDQRLEREQRWWKDISGADHQVVDRWVPEQHSRDECTDWVHAGIGARDWGDAAQGGGGKGGDSSGVQYEELDDKWSYGWDF